MLTRRKILVFSIVPVLLLGWITYSLISTWRGIPDAYAAWDTGTLIIEYLETHDDQWPRSWEELLTARETLEEHGKRLYLYDLNSDQTEGYEKLRDRVTVDWNADPASIKKAEWGETETTQIVTRSDGEEFPVVWEGAEPNRMIWEYFHHSEFEEPAGIP